ncbi:MAG: hypothetical protein LC127_07895 [Chitinophagales bacterium]|nr:hypothetical protein [Chitinophagales bacterium]
MVNISVFGGNDGSINSSISGGTPEYTYYWSTGDTIKQIMHLTEGTYYLIITDANGCQDSAFIILLQPNDLEMPNAFSPNGDGFNDFFIGAGIKRIRIIYLRL